MLQPRGAFDSEDFNTNQNINNTESVEYIMRKAFDKSADEAKGRFGRLRDILSGNALDIIKNHLISIELAINENYYYGSQKITNKGLSSAIDMVEFVQIMLSFEDYILPITIDFSDGLTIITGETGSGKSILIKSIELLAGTKADLSSIRSGGSNVYNNCFI
ncbi:MAG: AAA family ATPase [Endomicrobium sp.]|nr:AAA family ATPase [Endomicrobium sp.]